MQLSHTPAATTAIFDDPNLIGSAGLVPILRLAETAGLAALADEHLSVPSDKGAHAGAKVTALVAGMVAGADSIEDMALLRHGGMRRVFERCYAPSTLGSFLRSFTFGHVRQLDAVASRFLTGLAEATPVLAGVSEVAVVDIDGPNGEALGLLISTPEATLAIDNAVQWAWRQASPWQIGDTGHTLEPRDRRVLERLAGGATDSTIARRLDSLRLLRGGVRGAAPRQQRVRKLALRTRRNTPDP